MGRATQATPDALWSLLREGRAVALIRHADAPGTGDPPGFDLADCASQRQISTPGRAQATALGDTFRRQGITVGLVLSSRWCRCLDTGRLAFGAVTPFPPLDSFFNDRSMEPEQSAAVLARIRTWAGPGTLVMVTHQVNITALTGIIPRQGEIAVVSVAPGGSPILHGRLDPTRPGG
ncbi:MAG: hypothetical protein RLY86_2195 [Pseudomonadota bacterium]